MLKTTKISTTYSSELGQYNNNNTSSMNSSKISYDKKKERKLRVTEKKYFTTKCKGEVKLLTVYSFHSTLSSLTQILFVNNKRNLMDKKSIQILELKPHKTVESLANQNFQHM